MSDWRGWVRTGLMAAALGGIATDPTAAAPPPISIPQGPDDFSADQSQAGLFGFLNGIKRSSYLLGDMWGVRTFLSRYGFELGIEETSEVFGNAAGGMRRGTDYDGLTEMVLLGDTQRGFGWYGGTFNVSALQVHGRNLSADNLGTLQTASGIEADRGLRLWEFWFQQKFLEEDRLDIKIGQQSLDQEFMDSNNAAYFVNTMFGWPMVPSADLPGGGPAYPLSALGIRARARPVDEINFLVGVFNGSPVARDQGDPQKVNASGTSFPLNGGALAIAELQYSYPALGSMVYPGETQPLARVYRIGAWYNSENFADQRFDGSGRSLADPTSTGLPRLHRGDLSLYVVADQMVWRSNVDPNRTISIFARAMGTPQSDRNLIDFSMNAGVVIRDPFTYRTADTFGLGMGYAHVSGQAAALDRDESFYSGSFTPVRGGETFVEATYQYAITPWCDVQPDVQFVFNPGGGIANPFAPGHRVEDELVFGVRSIILL